VTLVISGLYLYTNHVVEVGLTNGFNSLT